MAADQPGVLPVGHPARHAAKLALWVSTIGAIAFTVFADVTTQDHAVRAGSPWQDDPYDVVVSFTLVLVPALTLLILARAWMCRRTIPVPVFRIGQLLRASILNAVLVAATLATDWVAVALGADRRLWNPGTMALIVVLGALSAWAVLTFAMQWRATRRMPYWNSKRPDGDWVGDAAELLESFASRHPRGIGVFATALGSDRAVRFVRRHVRILTVAVSLIVGVVFTTGLAIGEGWTNPFLVGFGIIMYSGGIYGVAAICNTVLQIAVPQPAGTLGRATRIAAIAATLALPTALALRDTIWMTLGHSTPLSDLGTIAAILLVSALIVGVLAFIVSLALSERAKRTLHGS